MRKEEFIENIYDKIFKKNKHKEDPTMINTFTTKEWFIKKFKEGKNPKEAMNEFYKLDEITLINIFKNSKRNANKKCNIPSEIKEKFESFWLKDRKELEEKFIDKKISVPICIKKPVIFLNPGFGYEEEGALVSKDSAKILNAIICEKVVKELVERDCEIYLAFNLKYAGIDLNPIKKSHKNLNILFDERPPILGDSGLGKMYEASSLCMRRVAEKILKHNEKIKFTSICIHHDYSENTKDVGFKAYYQSDNETSIKFKENSKTLCELMYKNCGDVYSVSKKEGVEIKKHILEEDWAMANLGEFGKQNKYKSFNTAATVLFLGYMSNKEQLEKMKQKDLQIKIANRMVNALRNYLAKI